MTLFLFPLTSQSLPQTGERFEVLVDLAKNQSAEDLEKSAISWFADIPGRDKTRFTTFRLGLIYYKNKKWNRAEEAFQKLLVLYPEFSDYALYHLGDIKLEKEEYKSALNYLLSLINNHPERIWIEAAYIHAVCLEELKEPRRAFYECQSIWIKYPNAEFVSELNNRLERFYTYPD